MKTFNRTSLPSSIKYNGKEFKCNFDLSSEMIFNSITSKINQLKLSSKKVIMVNVLSRNLKNSSDLHNKPYKPSQWVFVSIN
jgi:hypothetical protein